MNEAASQKAGLAARAAALLLYQGVRLHSQQLDQLLDHEPALRQLEPRDAGLAHAIAASALRHHGEIDAVLANLLQKPLPRSAGPTRDILSLGIAQLLFMKSNAPAAINLAVELAKGDTNARHFTGLINAVLRKAQAEGPPAADPSRNMPDWLTKLLASAYDWEAVHAVAEAHMAEAALDITAGSEAALWAERLGGKLLPTGTIRLAADHPPVTELPGFEEGAWWVQDAAAALPAKLLGDVRGKNILDLCAAPGGKTAQLAAAGARVTAVDSSTARVRRLEANMRRLKLDVACLTSEVRKLPTDQTYDAVLLDAPCSATGTMRRHPDLAHLKSAQQVDKLASVQSTMLDHASQLAQQGGTLVYCVCSLLPREGEWQAENFLKRHPQFELHPIAATEIGGQQQFITPNGCLRTLPSMTIGQSHGLDGFFAARFTRR